MRIAAHQSQYLDAFLAAEAGLQAAADRLAAAVAGGLAPPTDDAIWAGSAITDRIPSITWTSAASAGRTVPIGCPAISSRILPMWAA